jgi:pilus assembly protein Flp/PilA
MKTLFARFAKDEAGATAIEYALIASLISIAIISAVTITGSKVAATFTSVGNALQ